MSNEGQELTPEKLRKEIGLHVSVDSKQMQEQAKRIVELEPKSHAFEKIAEELAEKLRARGVDIDSSQIKDIESFQEAAQTYAELAKKEERQSGSGGGGTVPLRGHETTTMGHSGEYESIEGLIDDLRSRADPNSPEKKEAEAIINELFRKTFSSIKKGELNQKVAYGADETDKETSEVKKFLEKRDRRARWEKEGRGSR